MSPDQEQSVAASVRQRVERALDQPTSEWITPDTGLSVALRSSVTVADGRHVFVKAATDDLTEQWLRTEYRALRNVPERFVPSVVDWLDQPGCHPILIVEDLRDAHWPASHQGVDWRDGEIDRVLTAVQDLSTIQAPSVLMPTQHFPALWPGILEHEPDRQAFLKLGLCSAAWLSTTAVTLREAEAGLDVNGDRVVHGDLRSDNICLEPERVIFVDWSHTSRGSAEHDLAMLLPTLHLEGGPRPHEVMPNGGGWAASGSASLTRRILDQRTLPPWLVKVFVRLCAINLSWAAACLGLPQPDGTDWTTS